MEHVQSRPMLEEEIENRVACKILHPKWPTFKSRELEDFFQAQKTTS